jgi:hypothetical protein
MPPGTTISTVGSGITRTAANEVAGADAAGACGDPSRKVHLLAKKVDSPIPRAVQNMVTVWPDSVQAAIASRQN